MDQDNAPERDNSRTPQSPSDAYRDGGYDGRAPSSSPATLGHLIDELNRRDYHVSWSCTLDSAGLLVTSHHLLVLAADRSEHVLIQVAQDALTRINPAAA